MTDPLFSVVVPVYNRADILEHTINSVLSQTLQDFEIIVADDGSSDHPEEVVSRFKDERIRILHQENAGGGAARNLGILDARGQYIALLDSDDLFLPEKLERYASHFPLAENKVLYSSMKVDRGVQKFWIRPSRGIQDGEDVGEYLFCANQLIQTSTIVLPSNLAKRVLFDPALRRGQDLDFCIRLQDQGAIFEYIDEPLTIWADNTEAGRTSYINGYEKSAVWLDKAEPYLTKKAVYGYRATVLAYHLAHIHPVTAFTDLLKGLVLGGVSTRTTLRQFLRAYLPRAFYRRVVNRFVSLSGQ